MNERRRLGVPGILISALELPSSWYSDQSARVMTVDSVLLRNEYLQSDVEHDTDRHRHHTSRREGPEDHIPQTGLVIHPRTASKHVSGTRMFQPRILPHQDVIRCQAYNINLV